MIIREEEVQTIQSFVGWRFDKKSFTYSKLWDILINGLRENPLEQDSS